MYHGTVSGDDLLFKDEEARIKAVINGLETKLKIKRGEPPSENNTKEIKELKERIYNLKAKAEAIRRQNKRKTNRRSASPKPEKSESEPEPEPEPEYVSDEQTTESDYEDYYPSEEEDKKEKDKKEKDKNEKDKKKKQGSWCCSRPSGQLKKTHKKRKRKQKQTKRRKKKKQTRKYKKMK